MGEIVAAMLSSHAYAFLEPQAWDERRRGRSMPLYEKRFGKAAVERDEVAGETLEDNERRFATIREGHNILRQRLAELNADAVVMIGNDQDEIFNDGCFPQFAVYTGEDFTVTHSTSGRKNTHGNVPALARSILQTLVGNDFDVSIVQRLPNGELISHAHREALLFFDPDAKQAVVPLFVNTIHSPAPSPARCYALGQALRNAIECDPNAGRVVLFASGGFSHFAPDFPWRQYTGPLGLGAICTDFDRTIVADIRAGRGEALTRLTSSDLFENGDLELRQTIVMMGALGTTAPTWLRYEAFYRAIMGLAVGLWEFTPTLAAV